MHSFMVWLAVNGRLKTHDKMGVWKGKEDLKYVFCKKVHDSHNHLFFECDFSSVIWKRLKDMVKLDHAPLKWSDIQRYVLSRPINNECVAKAGYRSYTCETFLGDLVIVSASGYFDQVPVIVLRIEFHVVRSGGKRRFPFMMVEVSIAASSSVPWIYLGQFWHTLKEDGSKYRLKFMLDRKELTLTLDDFRTIFQLPQAIVNNHEHFVAAPKFSEMMLYCFVNNIHVDYANLLWEGLHYSLERPSTLIPYPRFTKLIVGHYMTAFLEILRYHDKYHNLDNDMMVKNIFNSGKHKDKAGMKILSWMIIDEMKLTENYRLYATVFGVDVPMTQLRIPQRLSTQLTPPTPIPTTAEADDIILKDTIQLSLAEQKSRAENVENVEVDSSNLRQDDTQIVPDTRLEPMINKESPDGEITAVNHL
ncbi:retrovirus-related pol polyprotein from transposon TNT 1-94 [Tanacetum coccineum]